MTSLAFVVVSLLRVAPMSPVGAEPIAADAAGLNPPPVRWSPHCPIEINEAFQNLWISVAGVTLQSRATLEFAGIVDVSRSPPGELRLEWTTRKRTIRLMLPPIARHLLSGRKRVRVVARLYGQYVWVPENHGYPLVSVIVASLDGAPILIGILASNAVEAAGRLDDAWRGAKHPRFREVDAPAKALISRTLIDRGKPGYGTEFNCPVSRNVSGHSYSVTGMEAHGGKYDAYEFAGVGLEGFLGFELVLVYRQEDARPRRSTAGGRR